MKHSEAVKPFFLGLSHLPLLGSCFIPVAAKVQCPVKDDPPQFRGDRDLVKPGIFPNAVYADIYFTLYYPGYGRKVETDDIGEIVMAQVFLIDLEQALIGTEDIIEEPEFSALLFDELFNELLQPCPVPQAWPGGIVEEFDFGCWHSAQISSEFTEFRK